MRGLSSTHCHSIHFIYIYIFAAEAEWILSETMTGFLENFNLLRMFRVARIIRPLTLVLKFSTLNTGVSSRKCL